MISGDDRELNTTHRAVLTGSAVVSAFADAQRAHPLPFPLPLPHTEKDTAHKEIERQVKIEEDTEILENGVSLLHKQAPLPLPSLPPPGTDSGPGTVPVLPTKKKESHTHAHAPHHCNKHLINSSELWGPILVVCKGQDLQAWEEGLGAVFRSKIGYPKTSNMHTDIKHQVDKSKMNLVNDEVSSSGSTGHLTSSSAGCAESRIQFVGYYGSDSDRAKIRAYITPNEGDQMGTGPGVWGGLYSERSPCHVMIANYESFLSDISDFSAILWHSVVFDSPWGLLSNTHSSKAGSYASFTSDITHMKCRHRIFSSSSLSNKYAPSTVNINSLCSSLSQGKSTLKQSTDDDSHGQKNKPCVLPDLIACATMLFPALQNIVQFLSDGDDISTAGRDTLPGL